MKYIIIRCEDAAVKDIRTASLLRGAKTPHLQHLAQAGAGGRIRSEEHGQIIDSVLLHRALFGLGPRDRDAAPALCYASGMNLQLDKGETAWCCELVTQQEGKIVDASAGHITTKEGEMLIQALDDNLGSETRQWSSGQGSHHILVVRDPSFSAEKPVFVPSAEVLGGLPWKDHLPKSETGEALQLLVEQAAVLLESHPVNRVRVDLGENPANMIWLWGPSAAGACRTFTERTGLSAAVISDSFVLQGFARAFGLGWKKIKSSFDEEALRKLVDAVLALIEHHDLAYVHLRIETADPVERLCAMERIDQILFKALTEALPDRGAWRFMAAVDDKTDASVPVIAMGTGLPRQPIMNLSNEQISQTSLKFQNGSEVFAWFTQT